MSPAFCVNPSSHTVPHRLLCSTSIRPDEGLFPLTNRNTEICYQQLHVVLRCIACEYVVQENALRGHLIGEVKTFIYQNPNISWNVCFNISKVSCTWFVLHRAFLWFGNTWFFLHHSGLLLALCNHTIIPVQRQYDSHKNKLWVDESCELTTNWYQHSQKLQQEYTVDFIEHSRFAHRSPISSSCPQLCVPQPLCLHPARPRFVSLHTRLSSQICPDPRPKPARGTRDEA